MAGSFSDAQEAAILNNRFGGVALAGITTVYVALLTDTNTTTQRDAGTVTEVSTGTWTNYQRAPVTNNTTNFPNATGVAPTTKNNGTAIGPTGFLSSGTTIAAGSAVVVTAVAFYDAATAGNFIGWGDLATTKSVSNGDTFTLPINAVTITLD